MERSPDRDRRGQAALDCSVNKACPSPCQIGSREHELAFRHPGGWDRSGQLSRAIH